MSDPLFEPPPEAYARPSPGRRAVRPRDAATLIIVRRDGPRPRLLMGRRHGQHDFMPGKWVFPGGRVERADGRAPSASELRSETTARLAQGASPSRIRALAMAAVRETFEEAGLLLARPAAPRPAAGPWREFLAQGALADLEALDVVARAITPPAIGKRFDARFFMADAERLISLERLPDCGELDELAWLELEETLDMDLAQITRFVVRETAARLEDPARPAPFTRMLHGRPRVARF